MAEPIRRIAVMNRGEAATRCFRAIRELRAEEDLPLIGIALYTDPDLFAPFVREADEAIALGPALRGTERPRLAYLDQDRILAALRASRAEAVWRGWGFLAEDASFVGRLEASGLIFLGPRAETVRLLGDKILAKRMAESCEIPVPAWSEAAGDLDSVREAAEQIAFADQIVLNKTDLVSAEELAAVEAQIRRLNPLAPIHRAQRSDVPLDAILGRGGFDLARITELEPEFLNPAHVSPGFHKTLESTEIMLQMVAAGRGITALPRWLMDQYPADWSLAYKSLGKNGVFKKIYLGIHDNDLQVPYIQRFINIAEANPPS